MMRECASRNCSFDDSATGSMLARFLKRAGDGTIKVVEMWVCPDCANTDEELCMADYVDNGAVSGVTNHWGVSVFLRQNSKTETSKNML